MIYVHVAENHRRNVPEVVQEAELLVCAMASLPPAPPPKPDDREPGQMPMDGHVEWYDRTRGFGVLVTSTNERVSFNGEVYSRATVGPDSGVAVTIEWKRARAGAWNVPSSVKQEGYKSPAPAPSFTLAGWISGFHKCTGKLKGVTRKRLLAEHDDDLEPWAVREGEDWQFGSGTGSDAWIILAVISRLATHDRWIRHFDYKDFDSGFKTLPAMVGLTLDDIQPRSDRQIHDYFIAECNRLSRTNDRLFTLDTGGDNYVVIALPPEQCEQLVNDGYLRLSPVVTDARASPPTPARTLGKRILGWLRL